MTGRLISPGELAKLHEEGTNAHRLWTGRGAWVERFNEDFLISVSEPDDLVDAVLGWSSDLGLRCSRIFVRHLVKQPGEEDRPVLVHGDPVAPLETTVLERGLRFGLDFSAGYSVGLFCDQRANRAHLETFRPKRVLNCFAYTCAFSVAAARAGAATLSLDLSRKSLERGRANFELNGLDLEGHRFIADDVFAVLPRLAKRGEKFDAIILDPPTFSRGAKRRVFRVERDLETLLDLARQIATPDARILLSTNATTMNVAALRRIGRKAGLAAHPVPPPAEYPEGAAAATVWLG